MKSKHSKHNFGNLFLNGHEYDGHDGHVEESDDIALKGVQEELDNLPHHVITTYEKEVQEGKGLKILTPPL